MPFVGREVELAALRAALDLTRGGRGQVAVLSGEAGIGKTSTIRAFGETAKAEGYCVLWGLCNDDLGAPLFWPWLQLLRAWVACRDEDALARALAGDAGIIARVVPEVALRFPSLAKRNQAEGAPGDSARAQFRLFHAMAQFWQRASRDQPLLLVIDDLQQDASASLKLLEFVAGAISDSPILIMGAHRESDLRSEHPLSSVLAGLVRLDNFHRLRLGGLDRAGTARLLKALTVDDVPVSLSDAVFVHSEGNPLFIQELARELLRPRAAEGWAEKDAIAGLRLPDNIRLLFGQRLSRASPECRLLLNMAAVIGRQFDQAVLGDLLTELSAGALSVALEEALSLRVIEELPQLGNYQFSHPLLHDTVYKDIPPPRRLALHRAVAEWLERRGGHDPDRLLPRLAFHFTRCAAAGAADKAIRYLKRAAARADALHAHWEAIGYYRDALRLDRQLGGNETAELIAALGQAQMRGGANELAEQTFLEAIELARRTNDASLFRRAVLGFENTSWREGRAGGPAVALLEEALACAAPSDQRSMIELNSALCRANIYADRPQQAIIAHRRAVGAARDLGEPHLLFRALAAIAPAMLFPELLEARLDAAREAMALAEGCGHLEWAVDHLTGWYFYDLVEIGNVEAARRIADLHLRVANSLRDPFLQAVGQVAKTILAMQQNVGPMVESEIEKARTLGQRWAVDRADGAYGLQMFTLRREQGQLGDLRPVLKHYLDHRPAATWQAALILVYLELGMIAEAEAEFRAIAAGGFSKVPRNALWPASLAYLAEACTYLNAATYAATLYENLVPYSGRNIMSGTVCLGSADRYLGMVATLLRDRKLCDQHFAKALALDARCNHPIWLAHTRYEYASALIARNEASDQPRAADFLKQALLTSEQLGLVALKRRCLSLRERLSARRDAPDGLSQREIKVLRLLAAGASNQAIATKLCISPHTVANHVRSILAKINCENRTQAAAYALRHGLADAE